MAKSLPMTDSFLDPRLPPSIRGPFAEVAREACYHQRGWQVARRNRAPSRPFFRQGYSCAPLTFCPCAAASKKSVPHYGFGEISNDSCINPTTFILLRYLKTENLEDGDALQIVNPLPLRLIHPTLPYSQPTKVARWVLTARTTEQRYRSSRQSKRARNSVEVRPRQGRSGRWTTPFNATGCNET